jgi:hypothetical protein
MDTRRRSPPLTPRAALAPPTRLPATCARPQRASTRSTAAAASAASAPCRRSTALKATASRTVSVASSWSSCATKPAERRSVASVAALAGAPSTSTRPRTASAPLRAPNTCSPAITLSSVLCAFRRQRQPCAELDTAHARGGSLLRALPQPDGPRMAIKSPRRSVTETLRKMGRAAAGAARRSSAASDRLRARGGTASPQRTQSTPAMHPHAALRTHVGRTVALMHWYWMQSASSPSAAPPPQVRTHGAALSPSVSAHSAASMSTVAMLHDTTMATNASLYSGAGAAVPAPVLSAPVPPLELAAAAAALLLRAPSAAGAGAGALKHAGMFFALKLQYDTRKMSAVVRPRSYSGARLSMAHA